jgi:hypothetical protein
MDKLCEPSPSITIGEEVSGAEDSFTSDMLSLVCDTWSLDSSLSLSMAQLSSLSLLTSSLETSWELWCISSLALSVLSKRELLVETDTSVEEVSVVELCEESSPPTSRGIVMPKPATIAIAKQRRMTFLRFVISQYLFVA